MPLLLSTDTIRSCRSERRDDAGLPRRWASTSWIGRQEDWLVRTLL